MIPNKTSGRNGKFSIPLVDADGNPLSVTGVVWRLLDQRGTQVATGNATEVSGAAEFTIPSANLTLAAGVMSAGHEIKLTVSTVGGGTEYISDYFVLVSETPLVVMNNSFVSYAEALSLRGALSPNLLGWDARTDQLTRSQALACAYENISRLRFVIPITDGQNRVSSYAYFGTGTDLPFSSRRRINLRTMTLAEFDQLPEAFRNALKRAQMKEANVLLAGDPVDAKRQQGIVSETIGESSMFFNSRPYLNLPISRDAYKELQRYIEMRFDISRG